MGTNGRRLASLAIAVSLLIGFAPRGAYGWNSRNQRAYGTINEDAFWNYDYTGYGGNFEGNVDWHVALFFLNNAEVDKVKNALNPAYFHSDNASLKMAEMDEGVGWFEDEDRGRKKNSDCPGYNIHYRVYAEPGSDQSNPHTDTMYNPDWGYWIMGTTHYDENDGCAGYTKIFGVSEQAEGYIARDARLTITGGRLWFVWEDLWYVWNCADPSFEDCGVNLPFNYWRVEYDSSNDEYHRWESNGLATVVDVS